MKKFLSNNKINFLFLAISLIMLIAVLGIDNISFKSTKWLYGTNDASLHQLGWHFFKNDVWRFPIGKNPTYGDAIGNSIVYTDSIPILAIFFKLFKPFVNGHFQYFSFWYLICFYLQLFLSFKIIKQFTNSDLYSFVGSIFFIFMPIFIFKVNWHAAVAGQWILLFVLNLILSNKINTAKLSWVFIIIFSSLVNYSFTALILIIYFILRTLDLKINKTHIFEFFRDFGFIFLILTLVLYLVGYFEVVGTDILGVGFGYYKLNLLSIFDPVNSVDKISWSWFLPDIKLSNGEELEGFNYLGVGAILMFVFSLFLFFNDKNKSNLKSLKKNRSIKFFLITSIFITLWALSNKISLGSYTLVEIPLNKYIFGILSVAKNTGRYFWIVNYFLLLMSIIIIYKCLNKKNSLIAIIFFLIIQLADTSAGIKERINYFSPVSKKNFLTDSIWNDLLKKYTVVKTTYPNSWSKFFGVFSYAFAEYNVKKTNIVAIARVNRKAAAKSRYDLYDQFNNQKLNDDTLYLVDLSHLIQLKHLFFNEDVAFFYRDNFWSMAKNQKKLMNESDKMKLSEVNYKFLKLNEKTQLNFKNEIGYYGFGWSHNFQDVGIWSEGKSSTLFFKTEKNHNKLKLQIFCEPFTTKLNKTVDFDVIVNGYLNKNVRLLDSDKTIEIILDNKGEKNNEFKIDFQFNNPISPLEILQSPDSRKLGILAKSIQISLI